MKVIQGEEDEAAGSSHSITEPITSLLFCIKTWMRMKGNKSKVT